MIRKGHEDREGYKADELEERLREVADGLRDAIRREVARRRRLGLPVYVGENGRVVERPEPRQP